MADTKDKDTSKKQPWLGPWQIVGLGLVAVAAVWHFGKNVTESTVYIKPRQVRCTFSDANESGIPGVIVQKQATGGASGTMESWHNCGGPSDANGHCAFVIGDRDWKFVTTSRLWGLSKKERQEHPNVEYRFALGGTALPSMPEETLLKLPEVGRVDPNDAGIIDPLPEGALDENGTMAYSTLGVRVAPKADPNAPAAVDPNK